METNHHLLQGHSVADVVFGNPSVRIVSFLDVLFIMRPMIGTCTFLEIHMAP
jgi:hypothetical protein